MLLIRDACFFIQNIRFNAIGSIFCMIDFGKINFYCISQKKIVTLPQISLNVISKYTL